ncbi:MAG: hypothetical protein ACE5GD_02625 [Candidatus Geothermarchaeales archaeon]
MNSNWFLFIVILSISLFLWYKIGSWVNRRRSKTLAKSIWSALERLGDEKSIQWLGSSGFKIDVSKPNPPFKALGLVAILEPRDIPINWVLARLSGKRDMLAIKGVFKSKPRCEIEALNLSGRGAKLFEELGRIGWSRRRSEDAPLGIALRGKIPTLPEDIQSSLKDNVKGLMRLSVRRTLPHLTANFALVGGPEGSIEEILSLIRRISKLALNP